MVADVALVKDDRLRTLLERFFSFLSSRYSTHTVRAYRYDILAFLTAETSWECINSGTKHDWRAYFAKRAQDGLNSNARALSAWRSFFKFCESCGESVHSGLLAMTSKLYKQRIFQIPDSTDIKQRVGALAAQSSDSWIVHRNKALVVLLYATGMRVGEALGLCNWDLKSSVVRIKGKGDRCRDIPILPTVHDAIAPYVKSCPFVERKFLFVGIHGRQLSYSTARNLVRGMQLGIATHGLRRSAATHLLRNGADIESVKILLGHANLSTTQRYIATDYQYLQNVYRDAQKLVRE